MYGQRSNQELFQFSGFVDPEVFQYDCIKIYLAFNESDKLFETKCEMAKQAGLKW
jgi:3-methyladenine DNA glycosylase Tag